MSSLPRRAIPLYTHRSGGPTSWRWSRAGPITRRDVPEAEQCSVRFAPLARHWREVGDCGKRGKVYTSVACRGALSASPG
jgi:hypothetical protein